MKQIPGMIIGETNEAYHANNEYNSFSDIKKLIHSPELYKKHIDGLLSNEHKDAWDIGNAVHTAILEPSKLGEYCFVDETFNGAKKEGKALKAECEKDGRKLLNAANSKIYEQCVGSILSHNVINLFTEGEPEVTFRVGSANLKLQCRTDWICHSAPAGLEEFGIEAGERYVADLKTTRSIDDWLSDKKWKNPLTNDLFYAGQEAFYTPVIDSVLMAADMGRVDKWLFVVVEKQEPFRVAVISTPQNVREDASNKVSLALIKLIDHTKANQWTDERLNGVYEPEIAIY